MRKGSEVKVDIAVQRSGVHDLPLTEEVVLTTEHLADGPAAEHVVAVRGAAVRLVNGQFEPGDAHDQAKLNAWATVLHTVQLYEHALGIRINWSFGPTLEVEAEAGHERNAYYDPNIGRIRLFQFDNPEGELFDTAYARDVIAHETGHAILDALCPDLSSSLHPDGLAIHEAIADLTAVMSILGAKGVSSALAGQPYERFPAFLGDIAEGFDKDTRHTRMGSLRSVANDFRLPGGEPPPDTDFIPEDEFGMDVGPEIPTGLIESADPHDRSQVLSGALFTMLRKIRQNEEESAMELDPERWDEISVELAESLFERYAEAVLPPLLYLPPGELEFTDFIATYRALDDHSWGFDEDTLRRGLATDLQLSDLPELGNNWDPQIVLENDKAARQFVEAHRGILGIPKDEPFDILPRMRREREGDFVTIDEVVLKVSWERQEANPIGPPMRAYRTGSTIAFDLQGKATMLVKARPPSDKSRQARDAQLAQLQPYLGHGIDADESNGVLRLHKTIRALHILGDETN